MKNKSLWIGSLLASLLLAAAPLTAQSRGGGGGHSGGGGGGHHGGGGGGWHGGGGGWHGGGGGHGGWHGGGGGRGGWHGGGGRHSGGWHGGWHGGHGWHGGWHGGRWGWGWGGWYYPYWGWGWGWGYPYYGYYASPGGYYGGGYGGGYAGGEGGPSWAAVDTDISPDEARVYLDGRYIGTADDFDGFPDYLYLQQGHYKLEFQLEGFEPKAVEVDARPGNMTKVEDKLHKIPGAKQYGSYSTPEPEGGVQRFFGKKSGATVPERPDEYQNQAPPRSDDYQMQPEFDNNDRSQQPPPGPASSEGGPPPSGSSSDWRGRQSGSRSGPASPAPAPSTRLTIKADPPDAAVYLDDRFIGTAEEIAGQLRGVRVSPGRHRITVSRPGYREKELDVEVETGKTESVEVSLER